MLLANLDKAKKNNDEAMERHNEALNELKRLQEDSIADLKYELDTARELSENFQNLLTEKSSKLRSRNSQERGQSEAVIRSVTLVYNIEHYVDTNLYSIPLTHSS